MLKKWSILLLILLLSCICSPAKANTIYVDASASSCGDGSIGAPYKYLQDALHDPSLSSGDEIWVAEGTYNPDQNCVNPDGTGDRTATFRLIDCVEIYGGFPTGGGNWDDRNWDMNETILSGDLLGNDVDVNDPCDLLTEPTRAENSYHVVTASDTNETAILDGFTITAGNDNSDYGRGGGMYNYSACPTVKNCTFKWNSARGGYSYPTGDVGGGGMYNFGTYGYDGNSPTITDCNFIENWSTYGGGMCNLNSSPTLTNCIFFRNRVDYLDHYHCGYGGGIYGGGIYGSGTVTNCVFTDNLAKDGGGMYGDGTVTNCTFTENLAQSGGGMSSGSGTVTNCILWGNSGGQIDGDAVVTYSDVQDGWPGCGNINVDPCLVDSYHLDPCSACIEAGDPLYIAGPGETDIDGEPRIMYGSKGFIVAVDMGADEFYLSDYFILEDFERYLDTAALRQVWHATGGADVNLVTGPSCPCHDPCVSYQRHGGANAMAFDYNNTSLPYYSEAYAYTSSFDFGSDWDSEVNTLSLWFHGIPNLRGSHSGSGTCADPYVLNGDGTGLVNTKCDSFYFFYKSAATLFPVVQARVASIEDTDCSAMAGVMMRDTLDAGSVYYATVVTPDGRVILMARNSTNGTGNPATFYTPSTIYGIELPHWVRITRMSGSPPGKIKAEHANDDNGSPGTWQIIGGADSVQQIGSAPTYIGLCVTSNSYGDMCTAEIDNVTMTPAGPPDSDIDICIDYIDNDPEPMYVGLEDSDSDAIWYYVDTYTGTNNPGEANANVVLMDGWNQWLIDLKDFEDQGVDLTDVNKIFIGFGNRDEPNAGGSGRVYFDDIYLFEQGICVLWPCPITYPTSNCGGNYTVSWEAVSCATSYVLEVNVYDGSNWSGWQPVQNYNGTDPCYEENVDCNTYRYRVKACNDSECGDWCYGNHNCVTARTTPDPPCPITYPTSNCGGIYQVCWEGSNCAISYELDVNIYNGNSWSGWETVQNYNGTDTCYDESVSDCNNYRYRVRELNPCGYSDWCIGDHNCVVAITLPDPPCPITYPTGKCGGIYQVCWEGSHCAISYELERSSCGEGNWSQLYSGPSTCYTESVSDCNNYRYRVRELNPCGYSDWCTGDHCCIVALDLPVPPCPVTYPDVNCGGNYPVCWEGSNCAISYELDVNVYNGTSWSGWESVEGYNGTDTCHTVSVSDCNNYRYRVRELNPCGWGDYCIGDHNCVVAITPPVPCPITYPDSNCGGNYDVCWTASECATDYKLQRFNFDHPEDNWVDVCDTSSTCYNEHVGCGNYRYRVKACNTICGCSDWCIGDHNCVVAITPPAPPATITYPGFDCDGNYTVIWAASICAAYYELDVNDGNNWSPACSGPNNWCDFEDVNCGVYRYRVRACNVCGCSSWCGPSGDCIVSRKLDAPASITYPPNSPNGVYDVCWAPVTPTCEECGEVSYELQSYTPMSAPYWDWLTVYKGPDTCYNEWVGGCTWYYRVRAVDDANVCPSDWTYGQEDCDVNDCLPGCIEWYNEWGVVRCPPCWCYPRQCHCDVDNKSELIKGKGYYYCHFKDLGVLVGCWDVREPPEGPGIKWHDPCICADFDHAKEYIKGKGYYRVHFKDLGILVASWDVREPPDGPGIEPNCLDCP